MPDLLRVSRALISVSDKTDLIPFAKSLASRGVEIISTGGTAQALAAAGIAVTPIDKVTGFPEMMGGRVKTLHPMVHGGLLALRDDPDHQAAMQKHGIRPIDLVCINLYPFEKTIGNPGVTEREAIEQIDIGGPSMIRSAAKNFAWVAVITSPVAYDRVVGELDSHQGCTSLSLRHELAAAAFGRTAEYDSAIASFLGRSGSVAFPQVLRLGYVKIEELRYGENPHQEAAIYRDPASTGPTVVNSKQLHGKELSYNNINDAAAALELVKALKKLDSSRIGAAVIKHTNPCGAASLPSNASNAKSRAVDLAIAGDPLAAYGGILSTNFTIDTAAAQRIAAPDTFFEVIIAPDFEPDALELIRKRWTGVRILATGERTATNARKLEYRSVPGGMLVQDRDVRVPSPEQWTHNAGPAPSKDQTAAAAFLECVCRFVGSNAIVIGGTNADAFVLHGAGGGQVDRVTACRIAATKAGAKAKGAIAVGDAFFPFSDGPQVLMDAGVSMIVHPGGSKRDQDTFDLCKSRNVSCMTTGIRHFKH